LEGVEGLIVRHCSGKNDLKAVVNAVLSRIPAAPTNNWGRDFLVDDLHTAFRQISDKSFPKVMDAIGDAISTLSDREFVDDLNAHLADQNVGYICERHGPESYWNLLDDSAISVVENLNATKTVAKTACQQAVEHLERAKANLRAEDERSRKDSVRDAMSAMEAMYKTLSGENDIKDAYKALRDSQKWGPDEIVKDGLSIWDRLHKTYPDIRHGQSSSSTLSEAEAHYWLERISATIKYMSRKYGEIQR
jgi:hypothetical protein